MKPQDDEHKETERLTVIAAPEPEKAEAEAPETPKEAPKDAQPTLKQAIEQQAKEEDVPAGATITLRKILGGDILSAAVMRKQIWLILLIALFFIIYISNGYSVRKQYIEIDKLQKELQDAKFKAMTSSSQLTEKSRQSNVLDQLRNNEDSVIHMATRPPYKIKVPENE